MYIIPSYNRALLLQGLWKKTNTYTELPSVDLAKESIIVLSDGGSDPLSYRFWSSFHELNMDQHEKLLIPVIESQIKRNDSEKTISVSGFSFSVFHRQK